MRDNEKLVLNDPERKGLARRKAVNAHLAQVEMEAAGINVRCCGRFRAAFLTTLRLAIEHIKDCEVACRS